MLEQECHRSFAFTSFHADQMPLLSFHRVEAAKTGEGLWTINVEVRNEKLIPTRSGVARAKRIGTNDLLTCDPADGGTASVVASGRLFSWTDLQVQPVRFEPARVQVESGVPSKGSVMHRFFVSGNPGDKLTLRYVAEKAKAIETTVELK
jgi:hypothetical protein